MKETRNYRVNHNPRQKQYYGVNRYTKKQRNEENEHYSQSI